MKSIGRRHGGRLQEELRLRLADRLLLCEDELVELQRGEVGGGDVLSEQPHLLQREALRQRQRLRRQGRIARRPARRLALHAQPRPQEGPMDRERRRRLLEEMAKIWQLVETHC